MRKRALRKGIHISSMAALSDAVVIGTVLTLVFAAVSYYLYSRLQQAENKLGLMESILLNLKMNVESSLLTGTQDEVPVIQGPRFQDFAPAVAAQESHESRGAQEAHSLNAADTDYQKMLEEAHQQTAAAASIQPSPKVLTQGDIKEVSFVPAERQSNNTPQVHVVKDDQGNSRVHIGFESMSWKELCAEAAKRNIRGTSHLNRKKLIDILNKREGRGSATGTTDGGSEAGSWAPSNSNPVADQVDGGIGAITEINEYATVSEFPDGNK